MPADPRQATLSGRRTRSTPTKSLDPVCGPRLDHGTPYCSKICCMVAHKQVIITKEHDASVETIITTMISSVREGFLELPRKAKEQGTKFVRADL